MRDRCTHHGLFGELLDLLDGFGGALLELFAVYLCMQVGPGQSWFPSWAANLELKDWNDGERG